MDASDHIAAAREALLTQIEPYCAYAGISESAFGRIAVSDARFVLRLRSGQASAKLMDRAQAFLRAERARFDGKAA